MDAALALAQRGLGLLRAKRVMESLLADGTVFVEVPDVEDAGKLALELAGCGIAAAHVPADAPDVRALREGLGLSREQFSARYGLDVETVRNWEAGRRTPDRTARSYLRAIANDPERVERAFAPTA